MRMKLLAAILRLADILDESRRRACRHKAETLLLDLESQSHWWRHYYTRDIEFITASKEVVVWFEFPVESKQIYREVVPQLQMPNIYRELAAHQGILNHAGLVWTASQKIGDPEFNTIEAMPEEVVTYMLKCITRIGAQDREAARQITPQSFKIARPYVNDRLNELRTRKDLIPPGEYLDQLGGISFDLWDVGSRRSAWMTLFMRLSEIRQQFGGKPSNRNWDSADRNAN